MPRCLSRNRGSVTIPWPVAAARMATATTGPPVRSMPVAMAPARTCRDHLGCLKRSAEIAAVQGGKSFPHQSFTQCLCLSNSLFGQRTVQMPLPYKLEIPLGLAVTNDDELSSAHEEIILAVWLVSRQELILSTILSRRIARRFNFHQHFSLVLKRALCYPMQGNDRLAQPWPNLLPAYAQPFRLSDSPLPASTPE